MSEARPKNMGEIAEKYLLQAEQNGVKLAPRDRETLRNMFVQAELDAQDIQFDYDSKISELSFWHTRLNELAELITLVKARFGYEAAQGLEQEQARIQKDHISRLSGEEKSCQ